MKSGQSYHRQTGVKLWFIRHGQASFGEENYDRLSRLGIQQSRILGEYFRKTAQRFDAMYSGELQRQKDTARLVLSKQPAASNMQLEIVREFNEYDFSTIINEQLPGLISEFNLPDNVLDTVRNDRRMFQKLFGLVYNRWVSGTYKTINAESYEEYILRIRKGLAEVMEDSHPGQDIGIFTSGGVINVIMQLALNLPDTVATELGWGIKNTSVSVFSVGKLRETKDCGQLRCRLITFNSIAHLDLENDQRLVTYR